MRPTTKIFSVNGMPFLAPDEPVQVSYEDIDAGDAGRDEAGCMHRYPVRYKVAKWSFSYSNLTEEEKQYMESIFPDNPTFVFRHPDRKNAEISALSNCYRSKYNITWRNTVTGLWSNYGFHVVEC